MTGKIKKKLSFGKTFRKYLVTEAFKDIGKLSPDQLTKGQYLNPNDSDNFVRVSGRIFYMAITKIKQNDIARANTGLPSKGLETLSFYNAGEYDKMECYLGKNNSSGYAIDHGTLKSVFSSQKSSGDAIMVDAMNVEEIADAAVDLLQHKQKRSEIGAKGRQLIMSRLNARWTAEQILGLYQTLLRA